MLSLPSGRSTTTGRRFTPSVERMATCGWLMTGIVSSVPNGPGLVIVNVPSEMSSGVSFFERARDGEVADVAGDGAHALAVGVADDRDHEALEVEVDGDPEVQVVVHDQRLVGEGGVHLGELVERVDDGPGHERQVGEAEALLGLPLRPCWRGGPARRAS